MDCQGIQQILSDHHSAEPVDVALLDEARAHCEECEKCGAFAQGLVELDAMRPPQAPDRAVSAALEAVGVARAEDTAALAEREGETGVRASTVEQDAAKARWMPRAVAFVSMAAIFAGAVVLTVSLMTRPLGEDRVLDGTSDAETAFDAPSAGQPRELADQGTAESTPDAPRVFLPPPDYVLFEGHVYKVVGRYNEDLEEDRVGTVLSSLDSEGGPRRLDVFGDPDSSLIMESDRAGSYLTLTPIVRVFEGTTYALTAHTSLDSFGQWPDLPAGISHPTRSDGSPVFTEAGLDDHGITVYTRVGSTAARGIAVPPWTSERDPAAGNPNWTWWEPRPGLDNNTGPGLDTL